MTLKEARGLLNWSQETLAAKAGISEATVIRLEARSHSVGVDNCVAVVEALRRGGLVGLSMDSIEWRSTSNARSSSAAAR